jgi:predicted PurR-regulated permease PerM
MPTSSSQPWRDAIRLTLVALVLTALAIYLFDVLLLFFAAALLAVVFRAPSEWLARRTRLDVRVALGIVLVFVAALLLLSGWLVGQTIAEQAEGVWKRLPEAIDELRGRTKDIAVVGPAMEDATQQSARKVVRDGLTTITAAFGAVANIALVLFVAVLLAAQPDSYVRGVLHLLPKRHRRRAEQVFAELGHMLRRWTLGQLCLMVLVGVLTYLGFAAIGLQYAGALGLLAGLFTFIPFIGSLAAGVIAVLIALAQGMNIALYAAAVYTGVQIIENLCEPFVQQRTVYLAPALLLFAQAVLGTLVGPVGIVLAAPLAAATIVVIKMLYIEDALGDHDVMPDADKS